MKKEQLQHVLDSLRPWPMDKPDGVEWTETDAALSHAVWLHMNELAGI